MHTDSLLLNALYYLLAAVITVPLFKRLGLGSILGYLFAGIVLWPHALGIIEDPESVLHFRRIRRYFAVICHRSRASARKAVEHAQSYRCALAARRYIDGARYWVWDGHAGCASTRLCSGVNARSLVHRARDSAG